MSCVSRICTLSASETRGLTVGSHVQGVQDFVATASDTDIFLFAFCPSCPSRGEQLLCPQFGPLLSDFITMATDKNRRHSSYIGVCYKGRGKWGSRITFRGQRYFLGAFDTEEEAARAYDRRARQLGLPERCNFFDDEAPAPAPSPAPVALPRPVRRRAAPQPPSYLYEQPRSSLPPYSHMQPHYVHFAAPNQPMMMMPPAPNYFPPAAHAAHSWRRSVSYPPGHSTNLPPPPHLPAWPLPPRGCHTAASMQRWAARSNSASSWETSRSSGNDNDSQSPPPYRRSPSRSPPRFDYPPPPQFAPRSHV